MNTTSTTTCPFCGEGQIRSLKRDYTADIGAGQKLRVPDVGMEVCDKCGEEILPLASARLVDEAISDYTDRLSPSEIHEIRDQYGLDQTEMSEALGLGSKTFHRWEKGSQYPSRSMGYYLRLLREFPEAFDWLCERRWKGRNRLTTPELPPVTEFRSRFPALASKDVRWFNALTTNRRNPARALLPSS